MTIKDERLKLMNQVLLGIKVSNQVGIIFS